MKNNTKHSPIGRGKGIFPGRVVMVRNKKALNWKDKNKFWWELENYDPREIKKMLEKALMELTGSIEISEALDKAFKYHNNRGYRKGERIAIKVNMNGSGEFFDDYSGKSKMSYSNPVLLKMLLEILIDYGIDPNDITVFDAARIFPTYFKNYCYEDKLKGINFIDRNNAKKDSNYIFNWTENFNSEKSYLPECVTNADYLINLATLKGHFWGVTLLAKNHFGTIMNSSKKRPPEKAGLHPFLYNSKMPAYSPLTDILNNEYLGKKCFLNLYDALICTQTEGTDISRENSIWYQPPFNGDHTKSVFASFDPIALDSVGYDLLRKEPAIYKNNPAVLDPNVENYLHEAALIFNPPSGHDYKSNNISLGVHEHLERFDLSHYNENGIDFIFREI